MATKTATVVRAALTALVEREIEKPMRQLGLTSRAALLRESLQYRRIEEGRDCARALKKYPAAVERVWALFLLRDLPHLNNAASTIDFCLSELKKTVPRALRRPLTKHEIDGIRAATDAQAAEWREEHEKYKARFALTKACGGCLASADDACGASA